MLTFNLFKNYQTLQSINVLTCSHFTNFRLKRYECHFLLLERFFGGYGSSTHEDHNSWNFEDGLVFGSQFCWVIIPSFVIFGWGYTFSWFLCSLNKLSNTLCGFWQISYTNAIGVKLDFWILCGRGKKGHCTLYSLQLKLNLLLKRESNKQKQSKYCWGLKGVFQVADAAQLTRASLKCWSEKEKEEEAILAGPLGVQVLDSHSHQIWVYIFIFKYIWIMLTLVFFLEN